MLFKHESHLVIVRPLIKFKLVGVFQHWNEELCVTVEKLSCRRLCLILSNLFIAILTTQSSIDPWLLGIDKDGDNGDEGDNVIPPALELVGEGILACVAAASFERGIVHVGHMLIISVEVAVRKPEINEIQLPQLMPSLAHVANHDVLWLEVAMDIPLVMECLQEVQRLHGYLHCALH